MTRSIQAETATGLMLDGVLYPADPQVPSDMILIAITGIHGNFFSNPSAAISKTHCRAAGTAWDWVFSGLLNNAHTDPPGDFSQLEAIEYTGSLIIGTYDSFTEGDPARFLTLLSSKVPSARENRLLFMEQTGHTCQMKEQEIADLLLALMKDWRCEPAAKK